MLANESPLSSTFRLSLPPFPLIVSTAAIESTLPPVAGAKLPMVNVSSAAPPTTFVVLPAAVLRMLNVVAFVSLPTTRMPSLVAPLVKPPVVDQVMFPVDRPVRLPAARTADLSEVPPASLITSRLEPPPASISRPARMPARLPVLAGASELTLNVLLAPVVRTASGEPTATAPMLNTLPSSSALIATCGAISWPKTLNVVAGFVTNVWPAS